MYVEAVTQSQHYRSRSVENENMPCATHPISCSRINLCHWIILYYPEKGDSWNIVCSYCRAILRSRGPDFYANDCQKICIFSMR
jgi:hypothetical protein